MNIGAAVLAICLGIFGCKRQQLDEDPSQWGRYTISVDQKTIAFSLPKGQRFRGRALAPQMAVDHTQNHYILVDAQYDYRDSSDVSEFEVLISLLKYAEPLESDVIDMQTFERSVHQARAAAVRDPKQLGRLQTEIVALAGGREWLQFSTSDGVSSYMTPFSSTHALVVGVRYWKKIKSDADWHRARAEMFRLIAERVHIEG
jgi:hypothetical protein